MRRSQVRFLLWALFLLLIPLLIPLLDQAMGLTEEGDLQEGAFFFPIFFFLGPLEHASLGPLCP
jgi:hypothetical protein